MKFPFKKMQKSGGIRPLLHILRAAKMQLLFLSFCQVVQQAINFMIFMLMRDLVDLSLAGDIEALIPKATRLLLFSLACVPLDLIIASGLAAYLKRCSEELKLRYLKRAFRKNINEFEAAGISRYVNDITNNSSTLEERFFRQIAVCIQAFLRFGMSVFLLIRLSASLLPYMLGLILFMLLVMWRSGASLGKKEKQRAGFLEEYTRFVGEVLSAFRLVKAYSLEKHVTHDFDHRSKLVQDKQYEIDVRRTWLQAMGQFLMISVVFIFAFLGLRAVKMGVLTLGNAMVIFNICANMMQPIGEISEAIPQISSVLPIVDKMEEHLRNQLEQKENKSFAGLEESLRFDRVSFSYEDNPVLQEADVCFKKGGKYLVIGASGSGKSTVLRLLRKYFNPDSGKIFADQEALDEISADSYYRHLANIEQQVFLFEDSIRNNLCLYKEVDEDELQQAIDGAGLRPLIEERGLDEVLKDNGAELSGGERARFAIARALLSHAEILLVDEAFASLNDEVAKAIEQNLLALKDVTLINVSHVVYRESRSQYDAVFRVARGKIAAEP